MRRETGYTLATPPYLSVMPRCQTLPIPRPSVLCHNILPAMALNSVGVPAGNVEAMEKMLREAGVEIIDETDMLIAANNTKGVYPAQKIEGYSAHPPKLHVEKSTALMEDTYHLTMLQAIFNAGLQDTQVTFDYIYRGRDPEFFTGLRVLAEALREFKFTPKKLRELRQDHRYSEELLKFLEDFDKIPLTIDTLPEGSMAYPNEPLFRVKGPIGKVLTLESLILNKLNFNSLITTSIFNEVNKTGDHKRITIAGLDRAHGDSHAEASLAAFYGGGHAVTDFQQRYNMDFRLPGQTTAVLCLMI